MAAPEPGTTLAGKYVVERVLGVGGMGVVVAARHIQLDQKVAIKYLLPTALANPEVVERFAREARAAAKIRGEHVARVIDVGNFDDGAPFMVLEYLEGENLEELLERRGPLPIAEAVGYILETCEALAEAHVAGVVHRDLKPANLFLAKQPDRRSIVKVLDFGISKLVDPSSQGITKTSTIMGTPFYMSPEQLIASKDVDARSDIWALGVILYELLTNHKPFGGESIAEIIGGILQNEPERISTLRGEVTLDLELCLARCLASKVANRHASVKELALALAPFAAADQRSTIEKIARVLGDSLAPPANGETSDAISDVPASIVIGAPLVVGSGFDSTGIVAPEVVVTSAVVATRIDGSEKPVVVAASVTAHAVASAVETPPPRRSPIPKIAIGVVLAAAAVGAFWGLRAGPTSTTPHETVGNVSPTTPLPSAIAPIAPTAAAAANVVPSAIDPSVADAAAAAVTAGVSPALLRKETPTASAARVGPRPSAAPSAPTAVAVTTATAIPSAATSAAKNPLQMGIK